jgi:hypothetical protein
MEHAVVELATVGIFLIETEKIHTVQSSLEAEFLDKIKTKGVFPPCYSQSPLQLCLEIYISSNSCNLL